MPHISISIRDPDEVIKTTVKQTGKLMLLGMVLSFVIKFLEVNRPPNKNPS